MSVHPTTMFTVEDTFRFTGRDDLILVPGVPENSSVRFGDEIEITRPDGTSVVTTIVSVEFTTPRTKPSFPIAVKWADVGEVPAGSRVVHLARDKT